MEGRQDALRERSERLQALGSAWRALAPSQLSAERRSVVETGRALNKALKELAQSDPSDQDEAAIAALDARLEELERVMLGIALEVPVTQLRATLPERLAADRRGVLDLMDLILGAEIDGLEGTRARLPTLDYLITLLCTSGDPDAPMQDPVALTHRLHLVCERSAVDDDPRLAELAAEFYAAAEPQEAELRNEVELRTLRQRKMELEKSFFAPGVLRAIVSYNASMMRRIDEEVLSSQDWGGSPPSPKPASEGGSLFERPAVPKIAEALRRRDAGHPPALDPIDRIAWCLDLADLSAEEREALLSDSTGSREGLEGTTILLSLLCRSAVVLDEEFPAIGIASSELTGAWCQELADLLQQEVNRRIASDYTGASALSTLKSRFLAPVSGRSRVRRAAQPATQVRDDALERPAQSASQPARKPAESVRKEKATPGWRVWPWARLARASAMGLLVLVALALVDMIFWSEGEVSHAELAQSSPFLADGKRSEKGTGSAFAGTLDDEWFELDTAQQAEAADALVRALRERGMRDIMVYDGEQRLRIQALGSQSARVVR